MSVKKYDNFCRCLAVLKQSSMSTAENDEIYRTGVIGQFNLCFELAWKALQAVLQLHGADGGRSGSPREIIKQGFRFQFIEDEEIWLQMLSMRNTVTHVYDEETAGRLLRQIYGDFIPAFERFGERLAEKIAEAAEK